MLLGTPHSWSSSTCVTLVSGRGGCLGRRRRVGGRRRRVADGWREGVGRVRGGDGGCRTVEDPQADARGDTCGGACVLRGLLPCSRLSRPQRAAFEGHDASRGRPLHRRCRGQAGVPLSGRRAGRERDAAARGQDSVGTPGSGGAARAPGWRAWVATVDKWLGGRLGGDAVSSGVAVAGMHACMRREGRNLAGRGSGRRSEPAGRTTDRQEGQARSGAGSPARGWRAFQQPALPGRAPAASHPPNQLLPPTPLTNCHPPPLIN